MAKAHFVLMCVDEDERELPVTAEFCTLDLTIELARLMHKAARGEADSPVVPVVELPGRLYIVHKAALLDQLGPEIEQYSARGPLSGLS
jgi:hypothetical protein